MADTSTKKLLLKLGINSSDWKTMMREIQTLVDKSYATEVERQNKAIAKLKEQFKEIQNKNKLQEQLNKTLSQETSEYQKQLNSEKLIQAQAKSRLANEQAITAELRRQVVEKKASENASKREGGPGGGGILGSALSGIAGAAGGGLTGSLFAGILGGGGVLVGVEVLTEGVKHLVEEFRSLVQQSGPLQESEETFSMLTKRAGIDTEEFANRLSAATHGLVSMKQIYQDANRVLLQGIPVTADMMVTLTSRVTELSRAQGKDVPQAIEQMYRAIQRGRMTMLGYQLGLDEGTKAQLRLEQRLTGSAKVMAEYKTLMEGMGKEIAKTGVPALTFTEIQKKMSNAWDLFVEKTALALTSTTSFGKYMEFLNDLVDKGAPLIDKYANAVATALGAAFQVVVELARTIKTNLLQVYDTIKQVWKALGVDSGEFTLSKMFLTAAQSVIIFGTTLEIVFNRTKAWAELLLSLGGAIQLMQQLDFRGAATMLGVAGSKFGAHVEDDKDTWDKALGRVAILEDQKTEKPAKNARIGGGGTDNNDEPDLAQKLSAARLKTFEAQQKQELEIVKAATQASLKAYQEAYDEGYTSLEKYVEASKYLHDQETAFTLASIQKSRDAEEAKAAGEIKDAELLVEEKKQINIKYDGERDKAEQEHATSIAALNKQLAQDEVNAKRQAVEDASSFQKAVNAAELKNADAMYKQDKLSLDAYLQKKKDVAVADGKLELASIAAKLEAAKKNNTDLTKLNNERIKSEQDTKDKLAAIDDERYELQLHKLEKDNADQQKGFDAQKAKIDADEIGNTKIKDLISLNDERYQAELTYLALLAEKGYEQEAIYDETQKKIADLRAENQKLYKELTDTFGALGTLGNTIGGFFDKYKRTGGVGKAFGYGAQTAQGMSDLRRETQTGGALAGMGGQGVFGALATTIDNLTKKGGDFADKLAAINAALQIAGKVVGGFISAMTQSQSGTAGALGGGLSTIGLSQSLSKIKGLGALGGPMGSAISFGVGAILGGVFGHARAVMEKEATAMANTFHDIAQKINDKGVDLTTGINQLIATRDKVTAELSGKKGGRQKLNAMLPGMNDQIQALNVQRHNADLSVQKEIGVMSSATAYQSQITSLEGIIDKYKEYALTVSDVTQAYKYLSLALSDYLQQQQTQLDTAQQQAIEDAIQLNDLLLQRSNLIANEAQQESDIMSQGVLTRSRTAAQQKLDQITQLRTQRDEQLAQMNQEIQTAQYKVNIEKTLFDLTGTRVNLETRLAGLQQEVISKDMMRIAALKDVVAQLQNGAAGSLLPAQYQSMLPADFQAMYQEFARRGLSGFLGTSLP